MRQLIGLGPAATVFLVPRGVNILADCKDLLSGNLVLAALDGCRPDYIQAAVRILGYVEVGKLSGLVRVLPHGVYVVRGCPRVGAIRLRFDSAVGVDAAFQQVGNVQIAHA